MPNEDLLRNYLLRQGFSPAAVAHVIAAYRDTSDMVAAEGRGYDSAKSPSSPESVLMSVSAQPYSTPTIIRPISQEDGRQIGQYNFEDGGFVRIVASPEIDTEEALSMVETIVALKRKEIERRKQRIASQPDDKFDPDE